MNTRLYFLCGIQFVIIFLLVVIGGLKLKEANQHSDNNLTQLLETQLSNNRYKEKIDSLENLERVHLALNANFDALPEDFRAVFIGYSVRYPENFDYETQTYTGYKTKVFFTPILECNGFSRDEEYRTLDATEVSYKTDFFRYKNKDWPLVYYSKCYKFKSYAEASIARKKLLNGDNINTDANSKGT